jgi:uncharacterized protein YecT (DUF1311 family)
MKTAILTMAAALALLALAPAHLASPALADEADGIDCHNATAQQDMNICADKDYRRIDAGLNATYKNVMRRLDGPSRDLLRASQREWIKFRDAECTYLNATNAGGSIYPMVYVGCLNDMTKTRIKQLQAGQQ